jgi:hypothetical protein
MKFAIWALAAVTRALSAFENSEGATSATNSPMMVTTTSISISVTPSRERLRLRLESVVISVRR